MQPQRWVQICGWKLSVPSRSEADFDQQIQAIRSVTANKPAALDHHSLPSEENKLGLAFWWF